MEEYWMYGIVMMMALNGAPDTPALGHKHGGCCGCMGSCYGGCSGCSGCYGGGRHHGHKHHGGGGCCGCYGYEAGCCGMSSCGCCGAVASCGCCGYGGGYGGGYAAPMGGGGAMPMPAPEQQKKTTTPPPPPTAALAAPATIVVSLPADATLSFEGVPTRSTAAVRQFTTPALEIGQAYHYTLTAQVVRDGKPVTATEEVTVRAGETTRVELSPAAPAAAAVALK
jgi:uncharacterized protein (TIGR03000 family)